MHKIILESNLFVFSISDIINSMVRDVAQPGSALVWGARGRWFESSRPDQRA